MQRTSIDWKTIQYMKQYTYIKNERCSLHSMPLRMQYQIEIIFNFVTTLATKAMVNSETDLNKIYYQNYVELRR